MSYPIKIFSVCDTLISPMPADKSAMGAMPTAGFQYCDALTSATGYGYHVFPPQDLVMRARQGYVEYLTRSGWDLLDSVPLAAEYRQSWSIRAPEEAVNRLPPFVQRFFISDIVQIFTGLFVVCEPGWSVIVRRPVNTSDDSRVMFYEGIVEADVFSPFPIFINMKFLKYDVSYNIEKFRPLLQLQPIKQECYSNSSALMELKNLDREGGQEFEWAGLSQTTKIFGGSTEDLALGTYKKTVRMRRRHVHANQ